MNPDTSLRRNRGTDLIRGLFDRNFGPVSYYFVRLGFSREESHDLAQDTFLRAYRGLGGFRGEAHLKTWLFTIAKNVGLNAIRAREAGKRRGGEIDLDDLGSESPPGSAVAKEEDRDESGESVLRNVDRLLSEERSQLLQEALNTLPPRMRHSFLLHYSPPGSRGAMDSTVKVSLRRADRGHLAYLRAELRDHPSFEELEAYGRDRLPANRRDELAEHLAICQNCAALLRYGVLDEWEQEDRGGNGPPGFEKVDLEEAWGTLSRQLGAGSRSWRPLSSYLAQGRSPLGEVLSVGRNVAEALADYHAASGVVRDLRPETVLVNPEDGHVRFLDLGIAAVPESLEVSDGRSAQDLVADTIRGASPEQVAAERLDQRSNLFSLGSLLYELVTGISPFRGPTPLETASRVLALEALPAVEIREDVPPALDTLLQCLLNKVPDNRPRSAAAREAPAAARRPGAQERVSISSPS